MNDKQVATPESGEEYNCVACTRPDSADNVVACDLCSHWWHYGCAGVGGSVSSREWICSKCLPVPVRAASVRSATSSHRARLQLKRLAEQQELERKQLELERKQLEMQKKHSQERYDLEESLVEEEADNRSRRSSALEIESRTKQVSAWVEQQTTVIHKQDVQCSRPAVEFF